MVEITELGRKEKNVFLASNKTMLRPLSSKNINRHYLSWLNDKKVTKYMESGKDSMTMKKLRNFYNKVKKSKRNVIFGIVDMKTDRHIGNIKLGNIDWNHRFGDLGIMIGDKKYWGKCYGREACELLLKYAFNMLKLNKVILGVYENHKSAIKLYQKVGFKIEGRIEKLLKLKNKYVDKIIMGISKNEFLRRCR